MILSFSSSFFSAQFNDKHVFLFFAPLSALQEPGVGATGDVANQEWQAVVVAWWGEASEGAENRGSKFYPGSAGAVSWHEQE